MASQPRHTMGFAATLKVAVCVLLGVLGGVTGFFSLLDFSHVRTFLDQRSGDGSADPYPPELHNRLSSILFCICVICGVLTLVALLIPTERWQAAILKIQPRTRTRSSFRWMRLIVRHNLSWMLGLTALATILRWPYFNDPIRFDESHNFLTSAQLPWFVGISLYRDPNNHVFQTLLMHVTTSLLGDAEWVIRLPSMIAGVCVIPLTFLCGRACGGRAAGIAAGSLTAVCSALIEYSVLGRGYTMICCFTLLNLLLAIRLQRRQSGWEWLLLIISSALGLWTIPVMAYANICIWGWLLIAGFQSERWRRRRSHLRLHWTVSLLVTCLLTSLLYLPVVAVSGSESLLASNFKLQLPLSDFLELAFASFRDSPKFLLRDFDRVARLLLGVMLLTAGVHLLKRSTCSALAILGPVLVCCLMILQQRVIPPARVGLFLLPLGALGCGLGFQVLLRDSRRWQQRSLWGVWVLCCVVLPVVHQFQQQSIRTSSETGTCPEAENIILELLEEDWFVNVNPPVPIIAVSPVSSPLVYYASRHGLDPRHFLMPNDNSVQSAVVVTDLADQQTVVEVFNQLGLNENGVARKFESWQTWRTVELFRIPIAERED